jgi:hypothetical protein
MKLKDDSSKWTGHSAVELDRISRMATHLNSENSVHSVKKSLKTIVLIHGEV